MLLYVVREGEENQTRFTLVNDLSIKKASLRQVEMEVFLNEQSKWNSYFPPASINNTCRFSRFTEESYLIAGKCNG